MESLVPPTVRTVSVNGQDCLLLPMAHASRDEIQEFTGRYLVDMWPDGVACIRSDGGDPVENEYAAPFRSDYLLKPASNPDTRPLVIPGILPWAAVLFEPAPELQAEEQDA